LTGRIVRGMAWRIGLAVFGIVTLAVVSAQGPNDFATQNFVPAAILCYPLILLSVWQIARRISKKVFEATLTEQDSDKAQAQTIEIGRLLDGKQREARRDSTQRNITAAVSELAVRATRFRPTV